MAEISAQLDNSLAVALAANLSDSDWSAAMQTIADNRHVISLQSNCSDTVALLATHLTDDNFAENPALYETCENLLKIVAEKSTVEDVLFELLEVVETTHSDNVFTTSLKALQICLRRQSDHKSRALEWALNSIIVYISKLPCNESVRNRSAEETDQLLEEDDEVRRILTNYLTLFLFYEPILDDIVEKTPPKKDGQFRDVDINRRNVLACFILQLLGPVYFLNMERPSTDKKQQQLTNTYSWQVATTIVSHLARLWPDPLFLFDYIERRSRWPRKAVKLDDGVYEAAPKDIFLMDDKLPSTALGVLFYLLYAERLMPATTPQIYAHLYQFESILYVAADMLATNEHTLHLKTLKLLQTVLGQFGKDERIPASSLDLPVHERFVTQLTRMLTQTPVKQNSQYGAMVLRQYVFQFEDDARYFLVRQLFGATDHNGLYGYLAAMYKEMVAEALNGPGEPGEFFCGKQLQRMLLKYICILPKGAETDLLQNSDQIITALNVCRYLAIRDRTNRTGFWDVITAGLEDAFLRPLQTGLDYTKAHYKMEQKRVTDGVDDDNVQLGVSLTSGEQLPEIDREAKLKMLASAMNTFDLMECLLGRVNECCKVGPTTAV